MDLFSKVAVGLNLIGKKLVSKNKTKTTKVKTKFGYKLGYNIRLLPTIGRLYVSLSYAMHLKMIVYNHLKSVKCDLVSKHMTFSYCWL